MVEIANTIRSPRLAERLAYKEKPYRDLAHEATKMHDQPGMANAFSTLVDLANHISDLHKKKIRATKGNRNPHCLPDSQKHIADAAHAYAEITANQTPETREIGVIVYNEPNYEDTNPIVATRVNEILKLWGANGEFGSKEVFKTNTKAQLRVQNHLGAVTIFAK